MTDIKSFPDDLIKITKWVYDKCNFNLTHPKLNTESVEYGACSFELNGKKIQHRVSKITPTKNGQFVTLWKRNKNGITEPFAINDEIDSIIITAKSDKNLGQFIFPKKVLASNGIITQNGKSGKRGIRIYPPWDSPQSKQAEKTQSWQLHYFLPISANGVADLDLAKKLLAANH